MRGTKMLMPASPERKTSQNTTIRNKRVKNHAYDIVLCVWQQPRKQPFFWAENEITETSVSYIKKLNSCLVDT